MSQINDKITNYESFLLKRAHVLGVKIYANFPKNKDRFLTGLAKLQDKQPKIYKKHVDGYEQLKRKMMTGNNFFCFK